MVMHSSMSKVNSALKNSTIGSSSSGELARAKNMQLQASNHDRPGISELFNSRDPRLRKKYEEKPLPFISKKEYVEKWLFNYNDSDGSTGSSVVFDSPSPKRPPLSPLKNFRGSKKMKSDRDEFIKQKMNEKSPRKTKENYTLLRSQQVSEFHNNNKNSEKLARIDNQCNIYTNDRKLSNRNLEEDFSQNKNSDSEKFSIYSHSSKRLSPSKRYFKPVSPQTHGKRVSHLFKSTRLVTRLEDKWQMIHKFDKNNEKLATENIETSDDDETDESPIITVLESPNPSPCYLDNFPSVDSPLAVEIQSYASSQANNEFIDCNSSETNELNRTMNSEENEIILNEVIEDSGSCRGVPVNHDNDNRHILIGDDDSLLENKSPSKSSIKSECNVAISEDTSDNLDITFCAEAEALDIAIDEEIEEVENIAAKNLIRSVEEVEDLSQVDEVSDDNHDGGEVNVDRTLIAEECSQKISQGSSLTSASNQLVDKSVTNNISLESSPPSNKKSEISNQTIINPTIIKRRRKPKKGSLSAKLQNLITSQMAFLRIWRHQMNQNQSIKSTSQSVQIKINRCVLQCSRQYLFGTIVDDKFNLLVKVNQRSGLSNISNNSKNNFLNLSNTSNSSLFPTNPITLLIDPVVGKINFNNRNILNIYQPWEVIDADKLTLSILYFIVSDVDNREDNNEDQRTNVLQSEEVVQQFSCPCLSAQRLVQSCDVKFTNLKPSVIQHIFEDSYLT